MELAAIWETKLQATKTQPLEHSNLNSDLKTVTQTQLSQYTHDQFQYILLHFISTLLSPKTSTFWDMHQFVQACLKFSTPSNLNFLTKRTHKFKLHIFIPWDLSSTQNIPIRSSYWLWNRCTHTPLVDTTCRWFVWSPCFGPWKIEHPKTAQPHQIT